ncbi:MAG: DUF6503 family protein [Myxococcota bacterium]
MNYKSIAILLVGLALVVAGCDSKKAVEADSQPRESASKTEESGESKADEDKSAEQAEEERDLAIPKDAWVADRVEDSRERLQDSEAGEIVWASIEAHGGLTRWFANGPIFFRFDYEPLGDSTTRDTYQTVDTWSSMARHYYAVDEAKQFGWTGEQAWYVTQDDKLDINPRFWSLTPYYFIAMPFVLADPGVNLDYEGTQTVDDEEFDVIKVTFGDDVGDAPDDYYVMYFDKETRQVHGLRYVVSYEGFFPEGGHSPEKFMRFEGEQTVDGITLAKKFPTYKWNKEEGTIGEKVTAIELSEVEFKPDVKKEYFEVPEEGQIQEEK